MQDSNTEIAGPGRGSFPSTRWDLIRDAADAASPTRSLSLEKLLQTYWRPVYAFLRRKWGWSNEDAKDFTQGFFATLCGSAFLERLAPERGRFRSYVMATLDNCSRARHRDLSKGAPRPFPIRDFEGFEVSHDLTPEEAFRREWVAVVVNEALRDLEAELRSTGNGVSFEVFVAYDLDPPPEGAPTYEDLSSKYGIKVTDVTNFLYRTRSRFRELLFSHVRTTVDSDEEARAELRELFGRAT